MGAATQLSEWLGWMRAHEFFGTFQTRETLEYYRWWAAEERVLALPDTVILSLLGKHPAVKRRRDRVKDPATGRVQKNAHGTPDRVTVYIFAATAPIVLPAGVTLAAGSRQPAAAKKPAAPMRRAA